MGNVQEFNSILRKDYNNNVKVINFNLFIISIKDYVFLSINPFLTSYYILIFKLIICSCLNLCDLLVHIWKKIKDLTKVYKSMSNWNNWEKNGLKKSWRIHKTIQERNPSKILLFGYVLTRVTFTIELINSKKLQNVTKKLLNFAKLLDLQMTGLKLSTLSKISKKLIIILDLTQKPLISYNGLMILSRLKLHKAQFLSQGISNLLMKCWLLFMKNTREKKVRLRKTLVKRWTESKRKLDKLLADFFTSHLFYRIYELKIWTTKNY